MADDTRKFYDNLNANLRGIHHQDSRTSHSNRPTRPYYDRRSNHVLKMAPNHTFKAYSRSTNANKKPRYNSVGENDLNIMDLVNYMGWSFTRTNEKGVQYRVGISDPKQENAHDGQNDKDSIAVALNPQPFYFDRRGKDGKLHRVKAKDQNGNDIHVTGKGAFARYSESDYGQGQGGDSLVRIIMDTQDIDSQRDAYQFIENMRKEYGSKTRFDPLDPDMKLPQSAKGRRITYEDGSQKLRSPRGEFLNGDPDKDITTTNPYLETAWMGYRNLHDPDIGGKALDKLHKLGYSDDTIQRHRIGWLPGKDDSNRDQITRYFNNDHNKSYGMGINSRLTRLDSHGEAHDRFGGMFIYPKVKHNQVVGINGFDSQHSINDTPVQVASNENLTHYELHRSTSPFGEYKNHPPQGKDAFDNWTYRHGNHTESGRAFATKYLSRKRGISSKLVHHMMDRDLIRVSLGRKGDVDSLKKLDRYQKSYRDLKDHPQDYKKEHGNPQYVKHLAEVQRVANDSDLKDRAYGHDAYIEFPHKLSDEETRNKYADQQRTVGADRIYFKPGTQDFRPTKKGADAKSMKNYGFNMTLGHDVKDKQRYLYVFKSAPDAMSYMDLHRQEIRNADAPVDVLSLGGTAGRTKTLSNFIHQKLDTSPGQQYKHIIFGTDNSEGGHELVAHYTEHARHQMPHDKVNNLFKVDKPPYKKDWNDTSQLLHNTPEDQLDKIQRRLGHRRTSYSISEYMDGIARSYYSRMTQKGRRLEKELNDKAKPLYVDYENKGEKERTTQNAAALRDYAKSKKNLSHSAITAQAHHDFEKDGRGIGSTMTPFEKSNTLRAMVAEDQRNDMQRTQDNGLNVNTSFSPSNQPTADNQHTKRTAPQTNTDANPHTEENRHEGDADDDKAYSDHKITRAQFKEKMDKQNRIDRAKQKKQSQSQQAAEEHKPKSDYYQSIHKSHHRGIDNRNKNDNDRHW